MPNGDQDEVQFKSPTTGQVQPVPQEHWDEALRQGYKPTTHVLLYAPDGTRGMVPNSELRDATQKGYRTTPETQFEKERTPTGFWHEIGSELSGQARGLANMALGPWGAGYQGYEAARERGAGVGESVGLGALAALSGLIPGGGLKEAENLARVPGAYKQRRAAGQSPGLAALATGAEQLPIPLNVRGMEAAAERGDPGAVLAQTALSVAETVGPVYGPKLARRIGEHIAARRRVPIGIQELGAGLGIPSSPEAAALAGRQAPKGISLSKDLLDTTADIAQAERQNLAVTNLKGSAATFSRAKSLYDYANRLWKDGHEPQIARHRLMPFDVQTPAQTTVKTLSDPALANADPAELGKLQNWADRISQLRTLEDADGLQREINDDLKTPRSQDPYGRLLDRAKRDIQNVLRQQISAQLQSAGESGVLEINRRYGALEALADRMQDRGLQEVAVESKQAQLPPLLNRMRFYSFMHPEEGGGLGLTGGVSFNPLAFLMRQPSELIGGRGFLGVPHGMMRLAESELMPPTIKTPSYVGRQPLGLLPGAPLITPPPEDLSSVRAIQGEFGAPAAQLAKVPGTPPTTLSGSSGRVFQPSPETAPPANVAPSQRMLPPGWAQAGEPVSPYRMVSPMRQLEILGGDVSRAQSSPPLAEQEPFARIAGTGKQRRVEIWNERSKKWVPTNLPLSTMPEEQ